MKTLVNKDNPQIRITAQEIIEEDLYYTLDGESVYLKDNWTLVEEEQKPTEWSEKDEAMRDNILRILSYFVGTAECDSNPSLSTSYLIFQREMDWLKSLRPQPRKEWSEEQPEVDFEKLALEKYPETMTYDSRGLYDRKKYDRDIYKQGLKDGYNLKHKIRNDNNNL